MIHKLKETDNYRSYLQDDTGDIIMQGHPDGVLIGMTTGETFFGEKGYYEVVVRGKNNPRYEPNTVRGHINHKRNIALLLKTSYNGLPTDCYDIDSLSETDYDGIIRDHARALLREFNKGESECPQPKTKS